jgi:hypothetical protein
MSNGDIVQQATPWNSTTSTGTFTANALTSPTNGNTDIICVVATTTVSTPTGYTLDTSDLGQMGIYIFRGVFGTGGVTGGAVSISSGGGLACVYRYEIQGTATVDATMAPQSGTQFTTTRAGVAFSPSATCALLFFGGERPNNGTTNGTAFSWSAFSAGLVQVDHSVSAGGTNNVDGIVAYVNGKAAGTYTPSATSSNAATGGTYGASLTAMAYDFPSAPSAKPASQVTVAPNMACFAREYPR